MGAQPSPSRRHLAGLVAGLLALAVTVPAALSQEARKEAEGDAAAYPAEVRVVPVSEGFRFVDPRGMTLYMLDPREARARAGNAMTFCKGECASRFVPLAAGAEARPVGLWAPGEGAQGRQWAYRGSPVFTAVDDRKPGDSTGDGWQDVVHPIAWVPATPAFTAPAPVVARYVKGHFYLADPAGHLLVTCVKSEAAACRGASPLAAGAAARGFAGWSPLATADGRQWTFRGKPVFVSAGSEPLAAEGGDEARPIEIARR